MKTTNLRVHFLPKLVEPVELAGGLSVVIDVLRATTTITAALAAGAREVIPTLEIDDARRVAANLPAGQAVLGGERGGVRIEGFDFGNSPREYTSDSVGGRTLVFTTTNGTRAMLHARQAAEVRLGAFVNLSAVVAVCRRWEQVDLVCSGTGGRITREDVLLAGAICARLTDIAACELNDQAIIARAAWLQVVSSAITQHAERDLVSADQALRAELSKLLALTLSDTQGGRNLRRLSLEADLDDAAAIDRYAIVPKLEPAPQAAGCEFTLRAES